MILLIDKTCKYCQQVDGLEKKYKNIHKFYVKDGVADIEGKQVPLDPRISMLPVLIDDINYYFTVNVILEHLEKSGELNAETSIF